YGKNAVFSGAGRKYDIVFSYPWSDADSVDITWPKGYDLDSADVPNEIADRQKISNLLVKVGVNKENRVLEYRRNFYFGGGGNVLFSAEVYPILKLLFDQIHAGNSHTITLKQL
ncbi:MAG: hypothetical protein ABL959_15300, partial [Pyrinomonadaceae bacterium]